MVWVNIPEAVISQVIISMMCRLPAEINANRQNTVYWKLLFVDVEQD